jgi:hypothetical protein
MDPEQDEIERQLRYASKLREGSGNRGGAGYQGQGRVFIVGNQLGDIASKVAAPFLESKAQEKMLALDKQRQGQFQDWMGKVPSASTTVEMEGPTPDGGVLPPVQTPKPPRQQAEEMQRWAMEGGNIRHPLAQAMGQYGLKSAAEAPLRQAEAEEKAAVLKEAMAQRAAQQLERDREFKMSAETQEELRRSQIEANRAAAQGRLTLATEKAAAKGATATAQQAKEKAKADMFKEAETNLSIILGEDSPLKKATSSGLGTLVDQAAGFFGHGTEGAQNAASLAPLVNPILMQIPRFEGPQSNADTQVYKEAAGRLADSTLPRNVRMQAAQTIQEMMNRRKGQFEVPGGDSGGGNTGGGGETRTYKGVTYVKKPGTTGEDRADWVAQ